MILSLAESRAVFNQHARRQSVMRAALAERPSRHLRVFISGPISGRPDLNRAAFDEAARRIEAMPCFRAVNPHKVYKPSPEAAKCKALEWCEAMCACIDELRGCHYVYMLPGWRDSRGARREYELAREWGKIVVFGAAR